MAVAVNQRAFCEMIPLPPRRVCVAYWLASDTACFGISLEIHRR